MVSQIHRNILLEVKTPSLWYKYLVENNCSFDNTIVRISRAAPWVIDQLQGANSGALSRSVRSSFSTGSTARKALIAISTAAILTSHLDIN